MGDGLRPRPRSATGVADFGVLGSRVRTFQFPRIAEESGPAWNLDDMIANGIEGVEARVRGVVQNERDGLFRLLVARR
jgi:hypothetical protein